MIEETRVRGVACWRDNFSDRLLDDAAGALFLGFGQDAEEGAERVAHEEGFHFAGDHPGPFFVSNGVLPAWLQTHVFEQAVDHGVDGGEAVEY